MDGMPAPHASFAAARALEDQITELAGRLNAATHRFLMLVAEYDRLRAKTGGVSQSVAHWLNWKCGINIGAARE